MSDKTLKVIRFDQEEDMETNSNCIELDGNSTSSDPPSPAQQTEFEEVLSATDDANEDSKLMYDAFLAWEKTRSHGPTTEAVLLEYFSELAEETKPSILWKYYYAIKNGLRQYKTQHIESTKLQELLGMHPRRLWNSIVFSLEEVHTFLKFAPNNPYLPAKVALVLGMMGSLKSREMYDLQVRHIIFGGSTVFVNIPKTAHHPAKMFRVTSARYKRVCRNYLAGRPAGTGLHVFHEFKCNKVGRGRLGARYFKRIAALIANYLAVDVDGEEAQDCVQVDRVSRFWPHLHLTPPPYRVF